MAISEATKQVVLIRDNCRCRSCGFSDSLTMEIDHITPRSLGGLDSLDNLQALCSFCNNTKAGVKIRNLVIQEPCTGFGDWETVTEKRLAFRQYIAETRERQIGTLADQARAWHKNGTRLLTIRKRLDKMTTSGIVEDILKNILSTSR